MTKKYIRISRLISIALTIILGTVFLMIGFSQKPEQSLQEKAATEVSTSDHLAVLWTSGDREVALKMVFMYTLNAKKFEWWDDITFIVWGPSSKLLSEDIELQAEIRKMQDAGIIVKACKACADQYQVSAKLEELGIEVIYMGKELTDYIKGDTKLITF